MKIIIICILTFLSLHLAGQDVCIENKSNGADFPYYKRFYRRKMSPPSSDSTILSPALWKYINNQIDRLTNGILRRRLKFQKIYTSKDIAQLFENYNPVIDDSSNTVYVQYRVVYNLAMNKNLTLHFGIDLDEHGMIMYKNELPALFQKKFPLILDCSTAIKKAMDAKKDITSFANSSLFYDPTTLKFKWVFSQAIVTQVNNPRAVVLDAVTGDILDIYELKPPEEIQVDGTGN